MCKYAYIIILLVLIPTVFPFHTVFYLVLILWMFSLDYQPASSITAQLYVEFLFA